MDAEKREQVRHALRNLAQAQAATVDFMEKTLALLSDELAIDPLTFWRSHFRQSSQSTSEAPLVDDGVLSVSFHGKCCFLGNTLPFRLLARLARRPNMYLTYEVLLSEVWQGVRSEAAVRSAVKRLRSLLRQSGMEELADAIDGSVPGHYALKIAL